MNEQSSDLSLKAARNYGMEAYFLGSFNQKIIVFNSGEHFFAIFNRHDKEVRKINTMSSELVTKL